MRSAAAPRRTERGHFASARENERQIGFGFLLSGSKSGDGTSSESASDDVLALSLGCQCQCAPEDIATPRQQTRTRHGGLYLVLPARDHISDK